MCEYVVVIEIVVNKNSQSNKFLGLSICKQAQCQQHRNVSSKERLFLINSCINCSHTFQTYITTPNLCLINVMTSTTLGHSWQPEGPTQTNHTYLFSNRSLVEYLSTGIIRSREKHDLITDLSQVCLRLDIYLVTGRLLLSVDPK